MTLWSFSSVPMWNQVSLSCVQASALKITCFQAFVTAHSTCWDCGFTLTRVADAISHCPALFMAPKHLFAVLAYTWVVLGSSRSSGRPSHTLTVDTAESRTSRLAGQRHRRGVRWRCGADGASSASGIRGACGAWESFGVAWSSHPFALDGQ